MYTPPETSLDGLWVTLFAVVQIFYAITFAIDFYLYSRPVNRVQAPGSDVAPTNAPRIVMFYPVLHELEETMRTTFVALSRMDYPAGRFDVIAIPNTDDADTIASLERLVREFPFVSLLLVPPTTDPRWQAVWDSWSRNQNAYWWHRGPRAGQRDLPPKKTRQLIYAFYQTLVDHAGLGDFLVNYIDADSCPPRDHLWSGAIGMQTYDVLQSQNVAGNLNASLAASLHAFDHMAWDGLKYPHLSADGHHPYWMLGKGLFFRASDLADLGGFHPWIAIEDPEVGMRFWKAGKRLGIIEQPLIEEVPLTFGHGITQRKRWVCGFFQSLGAPLEELNFTAGERIKAWSNFLPCLSLWLNALGFPIGAWALWQWSAGADLVPLWLVILASLNVAALVLSLGVLYWRTWARTRQVLTRRRDRLAYMIRINPVVLLAWWVAWLIPLWLGFWMYRSEGGLVWERTEKVDANQSLIRAGAPQT